MNWLRKKILSLVLGIDDRQAKAILDLVRGYRPSNSLNSVPIGSPTSWTWQSQVPLDHIPDTLTGKDADTVDGKHASDFADTSLSNVSDTTVLNKVKNVDGSGSGLDADKVDGKDAGELGNVKVFEYGGETLYASDDPEESVNASCPDKGLIKELNAPSDQIIKITYEYRRCGCSDTSYFYLFYYDGSTETQIDSVSTTSDSYSTRTVYIQTGSTSTRKIRLKACCTAGTFKSCAQNFRIYTFNNSLSLDKISWVSGNFLYTTSEGLKYGSDMKEYDSSTVNQIYIRKAVPHESGNKIYYIPSS